jgi:hypothetical protein
MLEDAPILKKQLEEIADVFNGADMEGYIKLYQLLGAMHQRHMAGDEDAGKILLMVTRFHSVIRAAKHQKID